MWTFLWWIPSRVSRGSFKSSSSPLSGMFQIFTVVSSEEEAIMLSSKGFHATSKTSCTCPHTFGWSEVERPTWKTGRSSFSWFPRKFLYQQSQFFKKEIIYKWMKKFSGFWNCNIISTTNNETFQEMNWLHVNWMKTCRIKGPVWQLVDEKANSKLTFASLARVFVQS